MNIAKVKLLLLSFLCIRLVTTQCGEGCLRCSSSGLCKLCDYTKKYKLVDNECILSGTENCKIYSSSGTCLSCISDYYLISGNPLVCQAVLTLIENCQYYSSATTCSQCDSGYYLSQGVCQSVTNIISNCEAYSNETQCISCEDGYIVQNDGKSCLKFSPIENCHRQSSVECKACVDSSFYLQDNYVYHRTQYNLQVDNTGLTSFYLYMINKQQLNDACRTIHVDHCQVLDNFYTCRDCESGYYQKEGICYLNPLWRIENCENYYHYDSCVKCKQGFYLKDSKKCEKVTPISRCVAYDTTSYKIICTECEENYYLRSYNYCDERKYEISNCEIYQIDQDGCDMCYSGYATTSDRKKCLKYIANCQTYFDNDDDSLKCLQCEDGYYQNTLEHCSLGSVANCRIYEQQQNVCKQCFDGYYLDEDGICQLQSIIANCKNYNPFKYDKCDTCHGDSYLLTKMNKCNAVQIEHCQTPINSQSCNLCEEGYNLTNDQYSHNICEVMPSSMTNCLIGEYHLCIKCEARYVLNQGVCVSPLEIESSQCYQSNIDSENNEGKFECEKCVNSSIQYNYKYSFSCVSEDEFSKISNQTLIQDCLQYYLGESGVYHCARCSSGIPNVDGVCQPSGTCSGDIYLQRVFLNEQEVQFYEKEFCDYDYDSQCSVFAVSSEQKEQGVVNYECIQCEGKNNDVMQIYVGETHKFALITGNGIEFNNNNQSYWSTIFECQAHTTGGGEYDIFPSSFDSNCKYYYLLHNNQYGCARCENGYSGVTHNWFIEHCMFYNEKTKGCIQCIAGYLVDPNDEYKCLEKNTVGNPTIEPARIRFCDQYSFDEKHCYLCQDGYYLDLTQTQYSCVARTTITNCEVYEPAQDKCHTCQTGTTLINNGMECVQNLSDCAEMADGTNCGKCDTDYYLNGGNCDLVTATNCSVKSGISDTCVYLEKIPFSVDFQCTNYTYVEHCINYNVGDFCDECESGYYLYESNSGQKSCIQELFDPNNVATTINCKIYEFNGTMDVCAQCKDNYHFDQNNSSQDICIQDQKFIVQTDSDLITQILKLDYNPSVNCQIYDYVKHKCVFCKTGFYIYGKKCCPLGKFGADCNSNIFISNCDKVMEQDNNTVCINCINNTFESHGNCCESEQYWDGTQCQPYPDNCSKYDEKLQLCTQCYDNFYFTVEDNMCCPYGKYYDGTDCANNISDANPHPELSFCNKYERVIQKCTECNDDYMDINGKCVFAQDVLEFCLEFNQETKECILCQDGYTNYDYQCCLKNTQIYDSTTRKCATVTSIANCIKYQSTTECQTCESGYFTTDTTCESDLTYKQDTTYVSIENSYQKCAAFNVLFDAFDESRLYKCDLCLANNDQIYYKLSTSQTICCEEGEYYNNYQCEPITVPNCLRYNIDTSKCLKCQEGFFLDASSDNCVQEEYSFMSWYDDDEGFYCNFSYTYDIFSSAGSRCQRYSSSTFKLQLINQHCLIMDTDASECQECDTGYNLYYNQMCCPQGTYFYEYACVKYDEEFQNCAYYDISQCQVCQYSQTNKFAQNQSFTFKIGNYSAGINYESLQKKIDVYYSTNVFVPEIYLSEGHCCDLGYFWSKDKLQCLQIEIKNCLKYDTNKEKCIQCFGDDDISAIGQDYCCLNDEIYDEVSNSCLKIGCNQDGYYESNDGCCKYGNYWDSDTKQCLPFIEQNCQQGTNAFECTECINGYSLLNEVTYTMYYNSSPLANTYLKNNRYRDQFNICISTSGYNPHQSKTQTQISNIINHCTQFKNGVCSACEDNFFLTDDGICCGSHETSYLIGDTFYACRNISDITNLCYDFDWNTFTCIKCFYDSQYSALQAHNQAGICCGTNSFLDLTTLECSIYQANNHCKEYDPITRNCLECVSGYYLSYGECCAQGYYYNKTTQECTKMDSGVYKDCKKYADIGACQECKAVNSSNQPIYLHRGRCVRYTYYVDSQQEVKLYNSGELSSWPESFDKLQNIDDEQITYLPYTSSVNCEKYNDEMQCIQCATNYYLRQGLCCGADQITIPTLSGTGTEIEGLECSSLTLPNNCLVLEGYSDTGIIDFDDNYPLDCKICQSGYYKSEYNLCCEVNDLPIITDNLINQGSCIIHDNLYTQCLQFDQTNSHCNLCIKRNYNDSDIKSYSETGQWSCYNNSSSYTNCSIIDEDTNKCTLCNPGYIMNTTEDACIQQDGCKISNSAEICQECYDNYYLDNNLNCGTINSSEYKCISYDNVTQECTQCDYGYILIRPNSTPNTPYCRLDHKNLEDKKCLSGILDESDGNFDCVECQNGYHLDVSNLCIINTSHLSECSNTTSGDCDLCYSGFYYQIDNTISYCTPEFYKIENASITLINKGFIEGCMQYEQPFICTVCDISKDYYLTNNNCCQLGYFYNGAECVKYGGTNPSEQNNYLAGCDKFINSLLCDEAGNDYLSSGKICEENWYFDWDTYQCEIISTVYSCKFLSEGKCLECITGYPSEGVCVKEEYYYDLNLQTYRKQDLVNSRFPNCNKVDGEVCTGCIAAYTLGDDIISSSQCCSWNQVGDTLDYLYLYDYEQKSCWTQIEYNDQNSQWENSWKCDTFDFTKGICLSCNTDEYYLTGTNCCIYGTYFNKQNHKCEPISDLNIELYPFKDSCQGITDEDLLKYKCSTCGDQKYLRGNVCCDSVDTWNYNDICASISLFDACLQMKTPGSCNQCSTNYVLTGENQMVCCPATTPVFLTSTATCASDTGKEITNCQAYTAEKSTDPTYTCIECQSGYYLKQNSCCEISDGSCVAGTIHYCLEQETNAICSQCSDGYHLEKSENKTICCQDGFYYESTTEKCIQIDLIIQNCSIYRSHTTLDIFKPECLICDTNYYLSYHHCCQDGYYYNTNSNQCEILTNGCKQQTGNQVCTECKTNYYLSNNYCCLSGEYYNSGANCDTITITNCIKSQDNTTCDQCSTNYFLYSNNTVCCESGYIFIDGQCKQYNVTNFPITYTASLQNCAYFNNVSECKQCASTSTYLMSSEKDACCLTNKFVISSPNKLTCSSTVTVANSEGCKHYDEQQFFCNSCIDGYYQSHSNLNLYNSTCCQNGEFFSEENQECQDISSTFNANQNDYDSNCIRIDVSEGICIMCDDGFELNSNQQCISIADHCADFNSDFSYCNECEQQYYISNKICCENNQFNKYNSCEDIDTYLGIDNCLFGIEDRCTQCTEGYYLTHNQCCQEGQYYKPGATSGPNNCQNRDSESHCKVFAEDSATCLLCDDEYVLGILNDQKWDCIRIDSTHNLKCSQYFTYESGVENILDCLMCNDAQPNQGPFYKDSVAITTILQEYTDPNCLYDIQDVLSNTINECVQFETPLTCATGEYIDDFNHCATIPIPSCSNYDSQNNLCYECETNSNANNRPYYFVYKSIERSLCWAPQIDEVNPPSFTRGYIDQCVADSNSQSAAQNVPGNLDIYYSVHLCTGNLIPFVFVHGGLEQTYYPESISRYNLQALLDQHINYRQLLTVIDDFQSNQSVLCTNPDMSVFNDPPQSGQLISNCALGMINADKEISFAGNNDILVGLADLSVFCTACKNGYRPKYNPRFPLHVYECELITNCNNSDQDYFNGCKQCGVNYVFGYKDGKIDQTRCVSTHYSDTNCLAADENQKCQICKQGYTLNYTNFCVKLQTYKCINNSDQGMYHSHSIENLEFMSRFFNPYAGCNSCDTGYVSLFETEDKMICTPSSYLNQGVNDGIYDEFCLRYGIENGEVYCLECMIDYIITVDHECVEKQNSNNYLQYCKIAIVISNQIFCDTCLDTYVNVNRNCVKPSLVNCAEYQFEYATQVTCLSCNDGYYLQSAQQCIAGGIQFCKKYDSEGVCVQCYDDHVLMEIANFEQVCMKVSTFENCLQYNSDQFQDKNLLCTKCAQGFIHEPLLVDESVCNPFKQIDNCSTYDKQKRFIDSTLVCTSCDDGYYLLDNKCHQRTEIEACVEYYLNTDFCKTCADKYYITQDKTQCKLLENGIPGCLEYYEEGNCRKCDVNLYLHNNLCPEVPVNNLIDNCIYYENSVLCNQCDSNYILENNECVEIVTDCLTHYNSLECEFCVLEQAIFLVENKRVCKNYQPISYCDEYTQVDPVQCLRCIIGYYLSAENVCTAVDTIISNCQIYSSATECGQCESGYLLSLNRKECVNQSFTPETNCSILIEQQPFCSYCNPGYEINEDGECVKSLMMPDGCFLLEKSGICAICETGYFMRIDKTCTKY